MNSKLVKASLAGAAAIALAAGGGTYAGWSDFGSSSLTTTDGYLHLVVGQNGVAGAPIHQSLAPGQNQDLDYFLTSADSGNTPIGQLSATIKNVTDKEDGSACTTNSEALAEAPQDVDVHGMPTNPLNDCGTVGELSHEAKLSVKVGAPVNGSCTTAVLTDLTPIGNPNGEGNTPFLSTANNQTYLLADHLNPGDGICVRVRTFLPTNADDKVQGDIVDYDTHFDLTQVKLDPNTGKYVPVV